MKRFFFSLIALSAAAIGCTQSAMLESPEIFNQEVSFSPYTGMIPVTKAASVDLTHLQKPSNQGGGFHVYGFLNQVGKNPTVYMDNELVTYDSSKNPAVWAYDNMVYWPDASSQSTLSFVAYNAVDNGSYANFVNDRVGYGLAQWTFWSRKEGLLKFAKQKNKSIGEVIKNYDFNVIDTYGFNNSQVTKGGVLLDEIDLNNFSSKKCDDLYIAGEVLDIDGTCGGYNLHFAFASAYMIAKNIIKKIGE